MEKFNNMDIFDKESGDKKSGDKKSGDKDNMVRILIVDDNKQIHKDFNLILNPETTLTDEEEELDNLIGEVLDEQPITIQNNCPYQFELDSAFQGQEASEMVDQAYLENRPYSVIFMDVRMPPGWNGIETIKHIWKKHPEIEMVICTAYSDYTWEDISNSLGISHRLLLLKKPFDNMEAKQLALSLSMKSAYYKKYRHHIKELESAVKSRTEALEKAKISAEIANRAKSTFLANMSHELRTPLNGILGYAELMAREDQLNDIQQKNLHTIHRCGDHLLSLINNVLDLSKIESGLMEKSETHFNLHQLIDDVKQMLLPRCQRHHLTFLVDVNANVPRVVSGDERKLRQILINLMGNSVKFTPALGEIKLKVVVYGEHRIQFSVIDTGQGIPKQDLEKIFQPFHQSIASSREDSTGLGLAICANFTNLLDGHLQVESETNKGSRFFFDIPLPEVSLSSVEQAISQKIVSINYRNVAAKKKWHLLVVDDDNVSRDLMHDLLKKVGFTISLANNGQQALEVFNRYELGNSPELINSHELINDRGNKLAVDLVISDFKMPIMDGESLLKELKQLKPDLPVILTSAYVLASKENSLLASGADAFLGKPLDSEKLLQIIARHIDVHYIYKTQTNIEQTQQHNMSCIYRQLAELPEPQHQQLQQGIDNGNLKRVRDHAQNLKDQEQYCNLGSYMCEMASKYNTEALQKLFSHNEVNSKVK